MNRTIPLLLALLTSSLAVQARVKLVALPERAATVIRLDNPTATLIEEERTLTLQKGLNQVDFSWKGVSIDSDSIRLTVLGHPDEVKLLNVSYPPNEAALIWEIASPEPYEERVRISYLLSNIDRLITYKGVADKAEEKLDLRSYLILRNFSGEDFAEAQVLLDYGAAFEQGIQHEETKQLLFFNKSELPIEKVWTWDAATLPWDPEKVDGNIGIPVSYRIPNTTDGRLGENALWGGKMRVFQHDGHGSTIFLGEDNTALVPVGEKMEVYIGDSRDIVVTQRKMREKHINIRRNNANTIILYDTDELIEAEIENFKDSPATLTMIQRIPGEWEMIECSLDFTKKDANTLEFEIHLAPKAKQKLMMQYHRRNVR